MSDRIFAVIWALLCIGGLIVGWQIHSEYSYEPVGPRPFPIVILALMLLCSLMLLVRRPEKVDWPSATTLRRLLIMMLALVIYAWSFEWLGFALATALLTTTLGLLFGARLPAALISGAILGIALWYAFDRLLDVTLPLGAWLPQ